MTLMYKGRELFHTTMSTVYKLFLLGMIIMAVFINGPAIEKGFFPVMANTDIIRTETVSGTTVDAWFVFDKKRSCTFVDLDFYTIDPITKRHHRVIYELISDGDLPPATRPIGKHWGGAWRLEISEDAFTGEVVAITHHRCHIFWISETQFFP